LFCRPAQSFCRPAQSWCFFPAFRATWSLLINVLRCDQTEPRKSGVPGRSKWITGIQNGIASLNDQELESLTSSIKSPSINSAIKTLHQNAASTEGEEGKLYSATHELLRAKLGEIISPNQ
jgi:hypothetical protein